MNTPTMSSRFGSPGVIAVCGRLFTLQTLFIALPIPDVGGGSCLNEAVNSLANISLRWMLREAVESGCGIHFDSSALARAKMNLEPEPSQTEIEQDMADALEPIHDSVKSNPSWWLLEIFPLHYSWQDADGVWHRDWG